MLKCYEHFKDQSERDEDFKFNTERKKREVTACILGRFFILQAYEYFGDVVSFDNTYKTNCYELIFGAFVGVNHHGQSILFDCGCGLLSNETIESFVWLLAKWLEVMPGDPPRAIIIDQDLAMTNSI